MGEAPPLVSIGDSFSCGVGVGVRVDPAATWVTWLARAMDVRLVPLAAPGARLRDVRATQLPAALDTRPQVVAVLVGLNDVIRGDFDAEACAEDLRAIVATLRYGAARVLLVRLPEPPALRLVPAPLRRGVQARLSVLNGVIDELSALDGVVPLDLAAVPGLDHRAAWAVDRVHPSATGHLEIGRAAVSAVAAAGLPVSEVQSAGMPHERPPSAAAEVRWVTRHGVPWLMRRMRSVVVPVLGVAFRGLR